MRLYVVFAVLLIASGIVHGTACDCHPTGNYNRVCLYTDPLPGSIALSGDTFNFDIVVTNFYRTDFSVNIEDIETSLISCENSQGQNCGSNYFDVDISPSTIAEIVTYGNSGECGLTPAQCSACTTGTDGPPMDVSIQIVDAPDGTYTLTFQTTWGPPPYEYCDENLNPPLPPEDCPQWTREIEVTLEFTSTGGCSGDGDCSGSTPKCDTSSGDCVECLAPGDCPDQDCQTKSCSGSNTCSYADAADETSCTGGTCCGGECDTSLGNTDFDSDCRSGPVCSGTRWEYEASNDGDVCSGECTVCDAGYCDNNDDSLCSGGETCQSGTCSASGCSDDGDCSGSTPKCDTSSGDCVECLAVGDCTAPDCQTAACTSNACVFTDVTDGTTCDSCGGTECECQSGSCEDITSGGCVDDGDCSGSTPKCDTSSGDCVECLVVGDCTAPDCQTAACTGNACVFTDVSDGTTCDSCSGAQCECQGGACTTTGCVDDGDCSGSTTKCDTSSGDCVECLAPGDCNTIECKSAACTGQACVYSDVSDGTSCSGCSGTDCECDSGTCSIACNNECTLDAVRCSGDDVEVCDYDNDNCLVWSVDETCSGDDVCYDGECVTPECINNDDCQDTNVCTLNTCENAGEHDAECALVWMTCSMTADGCCPTGCSLSTDADCESCSDDSDCTDSGELCCDDVCATIECSENSECQNSNACTIGTCNDAGTCGAECQQETITECIDGDGCCPNRCTAVDDDDCDFKCLDFITEADCSSIDDCAWCPLSSSCRAADIIECTSKSCNSEGEYCSVSCRWRECFGSDTSCECVNGDCITCPGETVCSGFTCVEPGRGTSETTRTTTTTTRDDDDTVTRTRTGSSTEPDARTRTTRSSTDIDEPSNKTSEFELEDDSASSSNIMIYVLLGALIVAAILGFMFFRGRPKPAATPPVTNPFGQPVQETQQGNQEAFQQTYGVPPNAQLMNMIKQYRSQGFDDTRIRSFLVTHGYDAIMVDEIMKNE